MGKTWKMIISSVLLSIAVFFFLWGISDMILSVNVPEKSADWRIKSIVVEYNGEDYLIMSDSFKIEKIPDEN